MKLNFFFFLLFILINAESIEHLEEKYHYRFSPKTRKEIQKLLEEWNKWPISRRYESPYFYKRVTDSKESRLAKWIMMAFVAANPWPTSAQLSFLKTATASEKCMESWTLHDVEMSLEGKEPNCPAHPLL